MWKTLGSTWSKWQRRNGRERLLLLEAFAFLGLARLCLWGLPFRWLARSLGRHQKEANEILQTTQLQLARMVGGAVRSAANYTPWESVCLPQAVAAKWMLKRRRIPGTLYLGVMKNENKPEKIAAHAWVRCGRSILTGAQGHRLYTVVSTFS